MPILSYPSDSPDPRPETYRIVVRRAPGPWHASGVPIDLPDLAEAVRAATSRAREDPRLFVSVVGRRGDVYWTNEV